MMNSIRSYINSAYNLYKKEGIFKLFKKFIKIVFIPIIFWPIWHLRYTYYKIRYGSAVPDPWRLIYINPQNIEYKLESNLSLGFREGTRIKNGEWDRKKIKSKGFYENLNSSKRGVVSIEKFLLFNSIKEFIESDISWKQTKVYKHRLRNNIRSKEKLLEEGKTVNSLYKKFKRNGYKNQKGVEKELGPQTSPIQKPEYNEISVAIGRDGEIFLEDGIHRFFIAKVIGLSDIPVRVILRHKKWQEKRYKIANTSEKNLSKEEKDLLDHPDMKDIINNY